MFHEIIIKTSIWHLGFVNFFKFWIRNQRPRKMIQLKKLHLDNFVLGFEQETKTMEFSIYSTSPGTFF